MITIDTKGNPQRPLVLVSSDSIQDIYGSLTAIPMERLNNLYISENDETIVVAEIQNGDEIRYLNVYLDCPEDAEKLLAYIQHL